MFGLMEKTYYWFWHDFCRCKEPFTHQIKDSYHKHPAGWVFLLMGLGTFIGHLFW